MYDSQHYVYISKKWIEVEILLCDCNFIILKTLLSAILTNQSILTFNIIVLFHGLSEYSILIGWQVLIKFV